MAPRAGAHCGALRWNSAPVTPRDSRSTLAAAAVRAAIAVPAVGRRRFAEEPAALAKREEFARSRTARQWIPARILPVAAPAPGHLALIESTWRMAWVLATTLNRDRLLDAGRENELVTEAREVMQEIMTEGSA